MSNQLQKVKFGVAIKTERYQNIINDTVKDKKKADRFVSNILSAVTSNPALQKCTPDTILTAGLLGESLNLVPSPQLGQYYLVPFKKTIKQGNEYVEVHQAQFILGYKGYLQLAIRSGYYKKINVTEIKEGELISYDPLEEEIKVQLIEDFEERENAKTIGYYAMFEYSNGFRKAIFWSKAKMESHADKYSQGFNLEIKRRLEAGKIPENELWKYSSNWYKDFDGMAKKTMLRQLISKWGILSAELQQALSCDDKVIDFDANNQIITQEDDFTVAPVEQENIENSTENQLEEEEISLDEL